MGDFAEELGWTHIQRGSNVTTPLIFERCVCALSNLALSNGGVIQAVKKGRCMCVADGYRYSLMLVYATCSYKMSTIKVVYLGFYWY